MGFLEKLTERETVIAEQIALGFSEKEIASNLFVSPVTIHNHTYNIRKKTNCRSAVDIARKFILSIDNPKQYFSALLFFVLQIGIIAYVQKEEVRRVPKNATQARFTPLHRSLRKDTLQIH